MKVKVVYSLWAADGFAEPLYGGVHDLEDVTEEQARSIAGARSAGVVEVVEATDDELALLEPHVQSQEDGEAAYAAAQESGRWQHGNLVNFIAERKRKLVHDDAVAAKQAKGKVLTPAEREAVERQIVEAEERLAAVEVPE